MSRCDRCGMMLGAYPCVFPTNNGIRLTHDLSTCVQLLAKALVEANERISALENPSIAYGDDGYEI